MTSPGKHRAYVSANLLVWNLASRFQMLFRIWCFRRKILLFLSLDRSCTRSERAIASTKRPLACSLSQLQRTARRTGTQETKDLIVIISRSIDITVEAAWVAGVDVWVCWDRRWHKWMFGLRLWGEETFWLLLPSLLEYLFKKVVL